MVDKIEGEVSSNSSVSAAIPLEDLSPAKNGEKSESPDTSLENVNSIVEDGEMPGKPKQIVHQPIS